MNRGLRWKILDPAPKEYVEASGVPKVIAQLLYNRGVKLEEIETFLAADRRLEGNPFLLPDMSTAVGRVYKALLSQEKIAIYGDFDVDGVAATVILAEGLSWFGAKVIPYIPDRVQEGHGLNIQALRKLQAQGASLIISADCGTTDLEEVEKAREMGMEMIVTDHHVPLETLPRAIAVINPKRKDSGYPYSDLAGAGTVFKLMQALFHKDRRERKLSSFLDLIALATVTDLVPLLGENRYLVKEGLKELNSTSRIGLQELVRSAGLNLGQLDSEEISWVLGPRLNAAGKVDNASISYQLLVTKSPEEARLLALDLEKKNQERQKLSSQVLSQVRERLATKMHLPLLIDADESYPLGVIGLVAGKLVEEFYKPAIIINLGQELCRGSCRSIPEFNLAAALEQCRDLLVSFGGHVLAAGFTVSRQNLDQLEERLLTLAGKWLGHLDLRPTITIDAEVPLSTFAEVPLSLIARLAPFGRGNPEPVFLTRRVEVVEQHRFGDDGEWLSLKLREGGAIWQAVDFRSKKTLEDIPTHIDIVYSLGKSFWSGEEVMCLNLQDFAPAGGPQQPPSKPVPCNHES